MKQKTAIKFIDDKIKELGYCTQDPEVLKIFLCALALAEVTNKTDVEKYLKEMLTFDKFVPIK